MLMSTSFAADSIWNFMTRYGSINSCAILGDVVLQIGVFKSSIFSKYFAEEGNCFMTWVLVSKTLAVKAAQATDLMFPKPKPYCFIGRQTVPVLHVCVTS